jgi:2-phosphosulfolactate phosphatase
LIHFEWGLEGARAFAEAKVDCIVIVDVMSFGTCVSVAVDRGAVILPCRWRDARAAQLAAKERALLASVRRSIVPGEYSLSPTSLSVIPEGTRLVLPSLNGSTVAESLCTFEGEILIGSIRNRAVTAERCARHARIGIVGCGERWVDGTLRPAYEDLLGAGALIADITAERSSEAAAAEAVFEAHRGELRERLAKCQSGRELEEEGFAADLAWTAAIDTGRRVARYRNAVIAAD